MACESTGDCSTDIQSYFLGEMKNASDSGKQLFCSSTQLSYPLYAPKEAENCRNHRYFDALK